jgi:hypothetical protein
MHVANDWPKSPSSTFAQAFPQINYALMWDSQLINAQAWRLEEQRDVGMKQALSASLRRCKFITFVGGAVRRGSCAAG